MRLNNRGGSIIQVLVASAIVSVVFLGLARTADTSRKNAQAVDTRIASTTVGLSLATYLSSQRLCAQAIGTDQSINPAAAKPEIKFSITGLGQIEKDTTNQKLSAEIASVFLDEIENKGPLANGTGTKYEALLKFAVSETRNIASANPLRNQSENQILQGQQSGNSLHPNQGQNGNAGDAQARKGFARSSDRTVGKFHFTLDAAGKIIACRIQRI